MIDYKQSVKTDTFINTMDIKSFSSAMAQIAEEKGISTEKIWETIESAVAAAYKRDYGKNDA